MIKIKLLVTILAILSVVSASNASNIIYVDASGLNDPGSGTLKDPFRRIQTGIDAAGNGDTVQISPGVYTGPGNYDLDPNGKSILICSNDPNDPDITAQTIIDPDQQGRGFYLHSEEDANCIISGLTIKDACTADSGAGIYCDNSSPSIINCIITDNFAKGYGCGVSCANSNSQIRNCTISNNKGRYGGGVECSDSSIITITNCTIVRNTAVFSGGGVFCDMEGHVVINSSIIWTNKLDYPEKEYGPQVCLFEESSASISYTGVEEGLKGISSIESTLLWGSGNIDSDPCFVSFDPNGDPNLWDFHLKSVYGRWDPNMQQWVTDLNMSLCIDAGDPNSDWSAEPWPNGNRINMGAYGGTNQASMSRNPVDLNMDGVVNFKDFADFAKYWRTTGNHIEDLNKDGSVGYPDLDIFSDNWLWQKK